MTPRHLENEDTWGQRLAGDSASNDRGPIPVNIGGAVPTAMWAEQLPQTGT